MLLRKPTTADRTEFLRLTRSSRRYHHPWSTAPTTARAFAHSLGRARRENCEARLVCRRPDGAIVGVFNLNEIVRGRLRSAYLGYYGFAEHAQQGYMTEGLRLMLRLAFVTLRLHRVEANIQPGNRRSIALARRAGFRREGFSPRYLKILGRWRDHQRWALTVEDWRASLPLPRSGASSRRRGRSSGRPRGPRSRG